LKKVGGPSKGQFLAITRQAKEWAKVDTQRLRTGLLADLKRMFDLAKQMATVEGVTAKQAQHCIRIMGYIGQIMNSLAKGFYEAKALRYFQNLEHMIRESKKDSERSAKT